MHHCCVVITQNHQIAEFVARIGAATSVDLDHRTTLPNRGEWRSAPIVVIDMALVGAAVLAELPRRDAVVAIGSQAVTGDDWEQCVRLGVRDAVALDAAEAALVEHFSALGGPVERDGRVIATVGACGGAGASVLAAAVGVAAHRQGRSVLVADCDPWGAGLDVLMGAEADPGMHWSDLVAPAGRLSPQDLYRALPSASVVRGRLPVLGFDRSTVSSLPVAVAQVVIDSARRAGDIAVIDLPRVPDQAADRLVENADLTVLVTPADVPACFAAQRQVGRLTDLGARLALVVRGPSPGGLGADEVADVLGIPLIAAMRPQSRLSRDLDAGRPPGADPRSPLGRTAVRVLDAVQETVP